MSESKNPYDHIETGADAIALAERLNAVVDDLVLGLEMRLLEPERPFSFEEICPPDFDEIATMPGARDVVLTSFIHRVLQMMARHNPMAFAELDLEEYKIENSGADMPEWFEDMARATVQHARFYMVIPPVGNDQDVIGRALWVFLMAASFMASFPKVELPES